MRAHARLVAVMLGRGGQYHLLDCGHHVQTDSFRITVGLRLSLFKGWLTRTLIFRSWIAGGWHTTKLLCFFTIVVANQVGVILLEQSLSPYQIILQFHLAWDRSLLRLRRRIIQIKVLANERRLTTLRKKARLNWRLVIMRFGTSRSQIICPPSYWSWIGFRRRQRQQTLIARRWARFTQWGGRFESFVPG